MHPMGARRDFNLGAGAGLWLNSGVPRRSKPGYRLPGVRRKRRGGGLPALAVLALLAGGAWFWWRHGRRKKNSGRAAPVVSAAHRQSRSWSCASRRRIFRARPRTCLRPKSPWRAAEFPPAPLTPRSARRPARAISVFQQMENLPPTGKLDAATRAKLTLDAPRFDELHGHDQRPDAACSRSAKPGWPSPSSPRSDYEPNWNSSRSSAIRIRC